MNREIKKTNRLLGNRFITQLTKNDAGIVVTLGMTIDRKVKICTAPNFSNEQMLQFLEGVLNLSQPQRLNLKAEHEKLKAAVLNLLRPNVPNEQITENLKKLCELVDLEEIDGTWQPKQKAAAKIVVFPKYPVV